MKNFYIHTMGCKANQFEGAVIAENLIKNGMEQVKDICAADVFVLNSCTVTHKSDNEAFYHLRSAKNKNPGIVNVLTGCIAQVEREKLLENDFIDYVLGNDEKLNLFEYLGKSHVGELKDEFQKVFLTDTSKTRASLKIQDGCDNRCSYCIIPFARGKSRSADAQFVTEQINSFAGSGFKEVVLTG
ncbi:MAG: tRNA (N(6)-L-threonylcarbamoyladenosine(37)-C(2))-methylthiotransferase MtaB, partial [Heliobacteriaceae bacterium]|nr:tRNA (N(6)-L-threonylcarbamoyladenosine(37)-C(2))-methylthiotransferase MtaB [Heliobacteriaceae bacterium]